MDVAKIFQERLDERGETMAHAARQMGYPSAKRLENYIKSTRQLKVADFAILCKYFKVNPSVVLGLPIILDEEEYERVEVVDVSVSAGPGAIVGKERVKNHLAFRRDWLRTVSNAPLDKLVVIEADGSSMEPTIHDGDHLLVDMTQTNPRKDGLYVFEWDGATNVKRMTANPASQTLAITSDNPAHRSWDGIDAARVRVVGRVVWIGRKA